MDNSYVVRVDPRTIKKNLMADAMVVYGRKTVSQTVQYNKPVDGQVLGYVEEYVGTGLDEKNELVNPIMMSQQIVMGPVLPGKHTQITQHALPLQYVGRQPQFKYDYLPTEVECRWCKSKFPHTDLLSEYNDWDYRNDCPTELCNTICPYCRDYDCCEVEFHEPTDAELEKMMTQGLNQVVIEDA